MHYTQQLSTSRGGLRAGRRWEVNITPLERFGRVAVGLAGIIGGIVLLGGAPGLLAGFFEFLLIAAGLDLVVTGITGHCPLYAKLGLNPALRQQNEKGHNEHQTAREQHGHCR